MLRLPRVCLEIRTVYKTTSTKPVPEHEVPMIRRRWHDRKTNTHFANKIPFPATSPANDYWFDFPSIELEWKRLMAIYIGADFDLLSPVYPDFETFKEKIDAALEAYAANPVLPPTLAPKIPPPDVLALLADFRDDIETPDMLDVHKNVTKPGIKIESIALALGAVGITTTASVAAATLGELCRDNALNSTVASQIRAVARQRLAEQSGSADERREKLVAKMREKGDAPDTTEGRVPAPMGEVAV